MPAVTTADIQKLRQATGAGMMDVKKALETNDGDQEAAAKWLREKGLISASNRSDRENAQGAVAVSRTDQAASLVELKCETDFVAKSADFVALTEEVAKDFAINGEDALNAAKDKIDSLKLVLKENIELGKTVRIKTPAGGVVGEYLHVQNGRGVNGVLVALDGGSYELAHDIAVHVAFAKPDYLSRDEVPEDIVSAERSTLEAMTRNEGKPEAAIAKIVDGRMTGWYKDHCLLEQAYVKDEKQSIDSYLGGAKIVSFAQVTVGS